MNRFVWGWIVLAACRAPTEHARATEPAPPPPPVVEPDAEPPPLPVRSEEITVPHDLAAYAVRSRAPLRIVFLAGMCVHPEGYIQSFAHSAAAVGAIIGLQGDAGCRGEGAAMRQWSYDIEGLDRRIDASFEAAGLGKPDEILVIGHSQGAERAEQLVARNPKKYSRAVLIASPSTPSKATLGQAKAVALMSSDYDISQSRMRSAAETLATSHVNAKYFPLARAYHGQLGATPEASMHAALEFVTAGE